MSNPVLKNETFERNLSSAEPMTVSGAISKSALLFGICVTTAIFSSGLSPAVVLGGLILGLIVALIVCFKPTTAPVLAPVYAVAEGIVLGTVSSFVEASMKGVVIQAIALTGGVFCAMLGAYQMRLIRPTRTFVSIVFGATAGIALFYIVSIVLRFWGIQIPLIHGSGPYAILFSVVVCLVAAFNLIVDFAVIEQGAQHGAPKYMEWYAAFGLLVTLVWLYLEILNLLRKLQR